MDKLKRAVAGIIILSVLSVMAGLCGIMYPAATAFAETTARILYDGTPLTDASGAELTALAADTEVVITGSAENWIGYPVIAGEQTGYVRAEFLYFPAESVGELDIVSVKVLASGVGREVELKKGPSADSETAMTLSDGVRLDVTECGSSDYYRIVSEKYPYYISKDNVTTSLTRNQRAAVIIISVTAVAAAVSFGLIYLHRNRDRFKNKR